MDIDRHIVSVKLLGKEKNGKKSKTQDYAIEVLLSDESIYTVYRSKKQLASFNHKLINKFPVEAGYFNDREKIIPDCPFKKTPFGIKQASSEEGRVGRLLNTYLKGLSALPPKMIKCDIVLQFMSLRTSDMEANSETKEKKSKLKQRKESLIAATDSQISKPLQLRSYVTVADFVSAKFRFRKDMIVQVVQKDPKGWWLIDAHGELGWAPASYLILKDEDETEKEEEENESLVLQDRVGARYISTAKYESKQEDEISFMPGAIVRVTRKHIDGWWLVKYNGREGFVPGLKFRKFDKRQATHYVKNIKRKYSQRKSTIIKPTMQINWQKEGVDSDINKEGLAVHECVSTFVGKPEKFEINLNRGDMVNVIERKDNGWCYVRDWHGRTGWAPASYLKDIHSNLSHEKYIYMKKIGSQCVVVSAFDSETENELSIAIGEAVTVLMTSDDGWWKVRNHMDNEGLVPSVCLKDTDETIQQSSPSEPSIEIMDKTVEDPNSKDTDDNVLDDSLEWLESDDDVQDCYIVSTNYTKRSSDEIDAVEGEIACVIDHTHRNKWYVEIDGKEGWIPSDMLSPITDEELNIPEDMPLPPPSPFSSTIEEEPPVKGDTPPRRLISTESEEPCHRLFLVSVSTESSDDSDDSNDYELKEIERALEEAEKVATVAKQKADTLRRIAEDKRNKTKTLEPAHNKQENQHTAQLVERLV